MIPSAAPSTSNYARDTILSVPLNVNQSYKSSGPRLRRGHWCQKLVTTSGLLPI